jgi:ribonucleoside-diphosphate reductase alpha chain
MNAEFQEASTKEQARKYFCSGETSLSELKVRIARKLMGEIDCEKQARLFEEALEYVILSGRIDTIVQVEGVNTTMAKRFVQPIASIMEAAQTMRPGGGGEYDFSPIRPKGAWIAETQSLASGPIPYMETFNSMCSTVTSPGATHRAQMGLLRCDHPDIEDFIIAKCADDPNLPRDRCSFRNFNLSVGVTDALMQAVEADSEFELTHAAEPGPDIKAQGAYRREDGKWTYRKVRARALFDKIVRASHVCAEPGMIFLDRVSRDNNPRYIEAIAATNLCMKHPLHPYGCRDLGHVNLTRFVREPFTPNAWFDSDKLEDIVQTLVRMLDNILDLVAWPLPFSEQQREVQAKRRIGIGITGLGDTFVMLDMKYGSAVGREFARQVMERIRDVAYLASVELAKERGAFPLFNAEKYLEEGTFASQLPADVMQKIWEHGIRNSHLLSLEPPGTGSLTFGNDCSCGCEPVFDSVRTRKVDEDARHLPEPLGVADYLKMLKVLVPYVDTAINKTIRVSTDHSFDDFKSIYFDAWKCGLKGTATYRPNDETGPVPVLSNETKALPEAPDAVHPDRRFKLAKLPETAMKSLRWLDRPHMPNGNPSCTYMVESPRGDFAVMIAHHVDGEVHPFEVWISGAEVPRGLGAIAKTLSADMRSFDRGWLGIKLDALQKCDGEPFDTALPPTGGRTQVSSVVSAFARIVKYHATQVGWLEGKGDDSLVDAMMFREEPKAGTRGTLSWTVDIENPATGDDFAMFVKELEIPDGTRRPYSVWLAGRYPKNFDGLCRLLSIDMRIVDPAWIGMKLRKLANHKARQENFLAQVPNSEKRANFTSTVAYMARLLIYRYHWLDLLNEDGTARTKSLFLSSEVLNPLTPDPRFLIPGRRSVG